MIDAHMFWPEDLLQQIDARSSELGINRSRYIRIVCKLDLMEKRLTKEIVKSYKL